MSTKFFWGLRDGPNEKSTLNRKYLRQAIDGSLVRLKLDYVDLVFCHRADPETPIEETVRAMHDMIADGKALYWGTSEWSAAEIMAAWQIAERHHLHKPVMEQPQYNLLHRERVEKEYARLYADIGLGTTIWSPLASGLLTGKYNDGIPPGSRGTLKGYEWIAERLTEPAKIAAAKRLAPIAADLGCTMGQMSLAWCLTNPHVSTVITGASRAAQVVENMKAEAVVPKLTPEVMARIDAALAYRLKLFRTRTCRTRSKAGRRNSDPRFCTGCAPRPNPERRGPSSSAASPAKPRHRPRSGARS